MALSDVVCIEGDCVIGETLVRQMRAVYQGYRSGLLGDKLAEFGTKFTASVVGVDNTYRELDAKWTRNLPFSSVCCSIKAIGAQAQGLTQAMISWAGGVPPKDVRLQSPAGGILRTVVTLFSVGAGIYLLGQMINRSK